MAGFTAGPCLLKDTMQLSSFNNHKFPLFHSAMSINEGLPQYIINTLYIKLNTASQNFLKENQALNKTLDTRWNFQNDEL